MAIVRNGAFCCSQPITDIHQHSTGCAFPETLTTGAAQTRPCNLTCSYSQKGNCRRLALIDTDEKSLYQLRGPRRPCRSSAISQLTQQQQQTFRCPISSRQTAKGRLGMPLLVIASVSGRTSEPVGRMAERQKGVLLGTYKPAEPPVRRAKATSRADLDSLGPSATPGIKESQKQFSESHRKQNGRRFIDWDKLLQTPKLEVCLHRLVYGVRIH